MTTKLIAANADLANARGQNDQDNPGGWLQEIGLLYRLTGDRAPCNRDEISVTMANGSRSPEACTRRAAKLLELLRKSATESIAADACLESHGVERAELEGLLAESAALRLALIDAVERSARTGTELATLRTGYDAARLEIKSLQSLLTNQGGVLAKVMSEVAQGHRHADGEGNE